MTTTWIRPVQLSLGAVALCIASWAGAQTAAPADGAAPAPAAPAAAAAKHKQHTGKHHHRHHQGEKGKKHADRTDPAQREAAAAREESRRSTPRTQDEQLQRNALARCDVFKGESDRHACVERVRNGQVSGSVKDGGTITEFTQQVPVR